MEIKIKPWEELTVTDVFVFCKVMQNEEVCRETIETLLNINIKKLVYVEMQKTIDVAYDAKGIRLDVYVEDGSRVFDVEIQTTLPPDLAKRARYYQSLIDIDTVKKGDLYNVLKESYIIFICTGDPFKCGLPCYTFVNTCREKAELLLDDKSYKVFYNVSAYKKAGNIRTGALLEYLQNGRQANGLTEKLDRLVCEAKNNQKWRLEYMTLEMIKTEKLNEGMERGIILGAHDKAVETAKYLFSLNLTKEQIKAATGLSADEIDSLSEKN